MDFLRVLWVSKDIQIYGLIGDSKCERVVCLYDELLTRPRYTQPLT